MSFYDDAKTISLMSGAAGKDGKIYNVKPAPVVSSGGPVAMSGFTSANTDSENSVTISGETATFVGDGTAGFTHILEQSVFEDNKKYKIVADFVVTTGELKVQSGGPSDNENIGVVSESGTFTFFFAAASSGQNANLVFGRRNADTAFNFSVSNVSVFEVDVVPQDFNFYRGTDLTATRVGKDGYIEKGRENLIKYSNTLDGTGWANTTGTPVNYNAAIGGQSGYDGSTNAWLIEKTTTANSYIGGPFFGYDGVFTWSMYAKNEGTKNNGLHMYTPYVTGYFDLVNGTIDLEGGSNKIEVKMEPVTGSAGDTDRWYRCSVTGVGEIVDNVAEDRPRFKVVNIDGSDGGDGAYSSTGKIFVQNFQFEAGLVATDYIDSKSTTGKAGILEDSPRFDYTGGGCPKLLMEPQRTNKLPHSEYFGLWGSNGVNLELGYEAPDGTKSAYKISVSGGTAETYVVESGSVLPTDSRSIWAKTVSGTGTVNLLTYYQNTNNLFEITNEWQRFEISSVTTNTGQTNFYAVDFRGDSTLTEVLIWGAQAETGTYPTSYIPTYGAAGTRTLDGKNSSSDIMIPPEAFDLTGNFAIMMDLGDINYTHGTAASSFPLLFLMTGSSNKNFGFYFNPGTLSDGDEGVNVYFQNNGNYVFGTGSNDAGAGDSKILVTYNSTTDKLAYYINGELLDSETRALSYDASARGYFQALSATLDGDECSFEINKIMFFDTDLSVNDSQILTGTSYTNFAAMASELSYTKYE